MATKCWVCATVLAGFLVPAALGEEVGTVSGSGMAYVEKAPEALRLSIDLQATGKDMEGALKLLMQKREAAMGKLKELGVTEAQIRWDGPKLLPPPPPASQAFVRMANGRMITSGGPQPSTDYEAAGLKVAVLTLEAEWPLKSKDAAAALCESDAIKAKVKAADLPGRALDKSAEEEDAGGPSLNWQFVARLSEAEQAKVLAEAFAQAKARAMKLASAAELQLGPVSSLSSRYVSSAEATTDRVLPLISAVASDPGVEKPDEIVGTQPHKVRRGVQVMVSYRVHP